MNPPNDKPVPMCKEAAVPIDTMPAGRELDALVAEKVMGWRHEDEGEFKWWIEPSGRPILVEDFKPSTDIVAAWRVAEESNASVFELYANVHAKRWVCKFSGGTQAAADTAPLAICRAALKAVGR